MSFLLCSGDGKCGYHDDGGPEQKCPGMCSVEGCTTTTTVDGIGEMCAAHEFLCDMGFDLQEFARLTEGYSASLVLKESIKRTLTALRGAKGR